MVIICLIKFFQIIEIEFYHFYDYNLFKENFYDYNLFKENLYYYVA